MTPCRVAERKDTGTFSGSSRKLGNGFERTKSTVKLLANPEPIIRLRQRHGRAKVELTQAAAMDDGVDLALAKSLRGDPEKHQVSPEMLLDPLFGIWKRNNGLCAPKAAPFPQKGHKKTPTFLRGFFKRIGDDLLSHQ